jgi:FkbM family methyltransferase
LEREVPIQAIRLFDVAVGDREDDEVPFFASDESSGISGLSAFRDTHREVSRVKLTTLRKVLADEKIARVDFLKIDTEGHDLFVLRGFPWERLQPNVVLCEFEDYKTLPLGYGYREIGDFLVEKGYQVFLSEWAPIVKYGVSHQWRRWRGYPCELLDPKGWGNFVAFRQGMDLTAMEAYLRRYRQA